MLFERFLLPQRAGLYADRVTFVTDDVLSRHFYRVTFEDDRILCLDRDAELVVVRDGEQKVVYADQLRKDDDVVFDNRDLLFTLKVSRL